MKTTLLTLLLILCLPGLGIARGMDSAGSPEAIARFGEDGDGIPAAARELLPDGFFTQTLIRAVADGGNFSAVLDLDAAFETPAISRQVASPALKRVNLVLQSRAAHANDIVVSLPGREGRAARNFLIRVEGLGSRVLDIADLGREGSLYLLSLQAFSARLELESAPGTQVIEAEILAPVMAESATLAGDVNRLGGKACRNQISFCSDCEETIELCSGGSCVTATANRSFWYTSSSGRDYYQVNVHYPVNGPIFHCHLSSFASSWTPQCKSTSQSTFRPATAGNCSLPGSALATHVWTNLDDTLFFGVSSSVTCTSGCSSTWTVDRL